MGPIWAFIKLRNGSLHSVHSMATNTLMAFYNKLQALFWDRKTRELLLRTEENANRKMRPFFLFSIHKEDYRY